MKESAIQFKIRKCLEKAGWYVIKIIACNKPGMCDLLCLRNGELIFVEVKRPDRGKVDPLQKLRRRQIEQLCFTVITAKSIDDIKHLCDE